MPTELLDDLVDTPGAETQAGVNGFAPGQKGPGHPTSLARTGPASEDAEVAWPTRIWHREQYDGGHTSDKKIPKG
ncbi:hypothetical protein [Nocardia sp. NPDC051570]|uniref:hypothetical protein n=1 Tax=Nocardia sp. NPDC051570 TaxID=3364324 RepID=UPI0037A8E174